MRTRAALLLAAVLALIGVGVPAALPANAAPNHVQIEGSGSSWSGNAMNAWTGAVYTQSGIRVVFTGSGSAQGRKDFAYDTYEFGVTDIAFQGKDPVTGEDDTAQGRPYAYLPIVAGGTSFPYKILVSGKKVNNLRLSGLTLAKIFTNQISNWNDPAITADNNGRQLPSLPITPVLHSEGSGSTAQFTAYLAKEFPSIWGPFNHRNAMTEYFPRKGRAIAQNGSDGVMNYIASNAGNGSIGYDEYSYPLYQGFPVAKLLNKAGYFTQPDKYNVAVALTQAVIDQNPKSSTYLMQKLDNVYVYDDTRTYPLSSYSYMILPTGTDAQDPRMKSPQRQTLVDFLYYAICLGQEPVSNIGYSPLPVNLVIAGFGQIQKLKTADPTVDISKRDVRTCNNPTFIAGQPNKNHLAEIAPKPPLCDKVGQGPCGPVGSGSGSGGNGSGGNGSGGNGSSAGPKASASATAKVDPETGIAPSAGTGANVQANDLAAGRGGGFEGVLGPLAMVELAGILVGPITLHQWLVRRRREHQ